MTSVPSDKAKALHDAIRRSFEKRLGNAPDATQLTIAYSTDGG